MDFGISLFFTRPEIILSVAGLALVLVAAWGGRPTARAVSIAAVFALFAAGAYLVEFLVNPAYEFGGDAFGGLFRMDAFGNIMKLLIYGASAACLVVTPRFFMRTGDYRPEYPVLIVFAAVGMGMMVSAVDLMTLYIGLELSSLASYVLASFLRDDQRSAEAGLKYFVLGALASGILLFGMSLVYGFAGTTNYIGIRTAFDGGVNTGAMMGIIFVLSGLAFKIAAVPFHMWTPDVYEGAPTPVTMFFATAPKIAAVAMTMRMALDAFGAQTAIWQQIVIFAALASIVVGALGAIGQTSLKRILAYSSINNIGFILIGLAVATPQGASAMVVYLFIYVIMTIASFVAVLMLRDGEGAPLDQLDDIAGLGSTRPGIAWPLFFVMLSLAGIPPLFGFWGKFVVFQAAVEADLIVLAAIGIAASVIGAFYYLKVCKVMMFDAAADRVTGSGNPASWTLLIVTTVILSPLGYLLTPWLGALSDRAADALFIVV